MLQLTSKAAGREAKDIGSYNAAEDPFILG